MTGKCPFGGDSVTNFNPLENSIVESSDGIWKVCTWYFMNKKVFEVKSLTMKRSYKKINKYRKNFLKSHAEGIYE